jgi:ribokinase
VTNIEEEMARVSVVGSLNMDLVIASPHLPERGETVTGGAFGTFPGGKGANQAVAAARLGAPVAMVGASGDDTFGGQLREGLVREGIDTEHVAVIPGAASGVAFITVDPRGHNMIVVAPGANARVTPRHVEAARDAIAASRVLLLQLEIPVESVMRAAEIAHEAGVTVVLDPAPAPAAPLPEHLLRFVDVVHPNEVEAKMLTGLPVGDEPSARAAARRILSTGCRAAVIKLGARGAFVAASSNGPFRMLPGIPVDAVDTTAAGDAFAGALGVALADGRGLLDAAQFATLAAAISVIRMGAQPSMPTREEVDAFARARGIAL